MSAQNDVTKDKAKREPRFLTPAQLFDRWEGTVAKQTLNNWRAMKKGPPFVKVGFKVLYPVAQLEAWEADGMKLTA